MNGRHLSPGATTVFESLHDKGLTTAAVNFTCYRGRTEHRTVLPGCDAHRVRPGALLLLQPVRVGRDRCAAGRPEARGGDDRRLRGRRRPLARHPRRLRLPRLLPLGLRLRVALARPGRRRREARRCRPRRRRAARGGRWPGRVPRALRRDPLLRPRPDRGAQRCFARVRLRRPPPLPRAGTARGCRCLRLQSRGPGVPLAELPRGDPRARRAPRRPRGGRRRLLPRGRSRRRQAGPRRGPLRSRR